MQLAVVSGDVPSGVTVKEVEGEVPAVFEAGAPNEPLGVVLAVRVYVAENGALVSAPPPVSPLIDGKVIEVRLRSSLRP